MTCSKFLAVHSRASHSFYNNVEKMIVTSQNVLSHIVKMSEEVTAADACHNEP